MKTKEQQGFRRLGRRAFGLQVLMLVLVMLIGGSPTTWANDDPGGGTYTFWTNAWGVKDIKDYFKTVSAFSFADDKYFWEFEFKAMQHAYFENHGKIYLQTSDNKWHTVAEWYKEDNSRNVSFSVKDESWGNIVMVSGNDLASIGGIMTLRFKPIQRCFDDGVKRIKMEYDIWEWMNYIHENVPQGDIRYEKDLNMAFADNEPTPDLEVDWSDDYCISLKARNVYDKRNQNNNVKQYYTTYRIVSGDKVNDGRYINETMNVSDFTVTGEHGGMIDVERNVVARINNLICGAYFHPMGIRFTPTIEYVPYGNTNHQSNTPVTLTRPAKEIIIDPFTCAKSLNVDFDKWTRKNTIRWTRYEEQRGWSANCMVTRPCRTDGKWYIIRYEDGQAADTYTLIAEMNGDATDLKVEDSDIDYDKRYNYRVIFLPVVLADKYDKDHLTSGVLANPERLLTNFWIEQQVSTQLEMPIKLTQDRSYDGAVRLKWEYCAAPTGENWTIEYRPAETGSAWRVLDSSMMVDTEASEASFDAEGSVCDMMDYRVKTTYMNRDFYSNVYTGNLPAGSYISEVKASTGTEEKTVIVKWKVARADVTNDIYFRVLRRVIGDTDWTLLTDEIHGTATEYTYTDDRPLAGSYYEYSVQAYGAKCDEQIVKTDEVIAPGFSQARGTITGHISYGSGTAVDGVKVNLVKASADEQTDQPQFLSRYIEGAGKGLQWTTANKEKYANVLSGDGTFTIQFWARPKSVDAGGAANQTILRLGNGLELGVRSDDGTHFYLNRVIHYDNKLKSHHFNKSLPFSTTDFTHVTAVYDHGMLTCYVGTDSLLSYTLDCTQYKDWNIGSDPTLAVGGIESMYAGMGQSFNGYIDDIRLWNRALSKEEVEANYTRILGGTEYGLVLYWPLDEGLGVKDYAFDVARQDGIYQLNHPEVGLNATPSATVPQQLGLYGVTDKNGNYIIRGIPFQQGGTNYEIAPLYGEHQFNPVTRSMFVSPTSLTANNIDFEDVSSFPMEGYVYYAGTNIPAEGIQFYVDGQLLTTDGEVQQSDAQGRYRISVPIGEHFVEAKLGNHKMVGGGRFPDTGKYNFDRAVTHDFADSTLVNFVGRIGGGERNDTLAVGFGASKNNIGTATITLKLNNESLSFNRVEGKPQTSATQIRTWESDTVSINSTAWTGFEGDDARYIFINTDPATGEFSAKLPPLKYIVKNIEIPKNPDIEFNILPEIDLSNVLKEQIDSLWQVDERGDSVLNKYKYHTKLVQTYFATPQVDISQPKSGKDVFGIQEYKGEDELGKFTVSDLWTRTDEGAVSYKYGYPIYKMGDEYHTELYGYEVYTNYDNGEAANDTIPLAGQVITVANEMSSDQTIVAVLPPGETEYQLGQVYDLKKNQLVLDSLGRYAFKWNAGAPNVVSPYTRHLGITLERKGRTYAPNGINAIVVGSLPIGNNFVTNGPDQVLMVLRDPPGAKSKTVWKTGSTKTKVRSSTSGGYGNEKIMYEANLGAKVRFMSGFGLYYETTDLDNTSDIGGGIHYTWNKNSSTEKTWTLTATEQVSTGATKDYCGSNGDVFIGYSTNLLMGKCRKVGFFRDNETAPFELKDDVATSLGDSVTTKFMYSTYEIEEVMIPKWRETRNGYLTQHFDTEAEARAFVNNTSEVLYATWVKEDDTSYGQEGTYVQVTPAAWESLTDFVAEDKVAWCNNQIESWQKVLYNNEYDKVTAIENRDKYWQRNISFDGGSDYSYTARNDTTKVVKHNYSHNLGGIVKGGFSTKNTAASIQFKTKMSVDTENGWAYSTTESDYDENTKDYAEFDYIFDDGNRGTDFSVDIYKSPGGWSDIFSLFGGQSYNPYQKEEKTQYYEPGQHILSNGTEQMENPDIQISTDGGIAVKSAVLTDIPAGQTGQFTLHLSNISTTTQGFDFTYNLSVAEGTNQHGLEILMDGVPANGRGIFIPAGETVKKVITVRQTDQSVLDYENIELWFSSAYQAIKIHNIAKLSVHFKPSSSPVELAITEPVVNCQTDSARLEMKVKGFNRQFKNLKNVGVQYRFQGNTQWTALHTWVTNKADSLNANYNLLPATGDLPLELKMISDQSYPEGNYEFRAFTTTPYGNEQVQVYSDVINVVKDITRPINIFTPTPANGILGYGDQLVIEFNEDIVPGYVSDNNVIVTAKLNDTQVDHEVALQLMPFGEAPRTVNPVFLQGDFSIDFWLYRRDSGTLLSLGKTNSRFALNVRDDGYVVATVGGTQHVSDRPMPKDEWTFVALSYKASTMTFDMEASADQAGNVMLFEDRPVELKDLEAFSYTDDYHLYLGGIDADIHSLSLYNIYRDVHKATATKDQAKDSYVYGLANYWPFDEGHGFTAADKRHTHDFSVPNRWLLENVNYGLRMDDNEGAKTDITQITTRPGDSYAIELWHRISDYDGKDVVFETTTPNQGKDQQQHNKLKLHYDGKKNLILNYDKDSIMVASAEDFPEVMDWRHLALNVVRGQAASFYLNGQRTAVIAETDVPPLEGSVLVVGKDAKDSWVDELRIWHASLSESRLQQNMYNTIDTADIYSRGLVAYYPFEKTGKDNGVPTKVQTLENMAHPSALSDLPAVIDTTLATFSPFAPPLKNAPDETPINTTPVASERKLIINLTGENSRLRRIEGTTLNITVDQIRDLHGNTSLPIRWTAYVQQNTLTWMKDSVNIIKKYGDDYTFDVDIENKSGSTELYTLYNMPQWLSLVDSERTDDVSPLKTKTLRFEVNPLVPVGNYDVAIGLLGNNGILEPLRIVMKVRGEKPQWAVDPTKYDHNMSIIGQVYIGGILMENPESMVAAFINGECRGVASPEKVRGAAYVTMNVYGNDDKRYDMSKEVTFRIWDASRGVAYTDANIAVPIKTAAGVDSTLTEVIFAQDKMLGNFDTPAIWTKSENVEQLIPIHQNWNWIAFGVEPQSTYLDHVFSAYAEWSMLLKSRSAWNDYNGAQWGDGTLKRAKANEMYKLKIDRLPTTKQEAPNSLLAVSGRQLKENKERAVMLGKGWNWIAYTPLTTMTVDEALAAANPQKGDIVKSQTGVAIYGEYGWEGSLKALESGRGYLYYSNASDTTSFLYPTETAASAARAKTRMAAPRRAPEDLRIFNPVPLGLYPSNMTMAIQLRDGDAVVDTAEVAAFISDECRGATRASENGIYYLVVSGDGAGQSMTLRTCLDGEIIDIDNTQMYVSDANIGTSWEPYVLDLSSALSGISSIVTDDSDDSDWWTLQGFKIGRKPTQPGVYIHHGEKIIITHMK